MCNHNDTVVRWRWYSVLRRYHAIFDGAPKYSYDLLKGICETLNERLLKEKSKRPLIADIADEKLLEFIAKHLFERSKFYRQSQLTINTDSMNLNQIVDAIKGELN